jgi:hypothetical protein
MFALLPASALNDEEAGETHQEVKGNKWEAMTFWIWMSTSKD